MNFVLYLAAVLAVTTLHQLPTSSALVTNVSNEQLRDGLLSLVKSFNELESKLDRHEQREKALGDVIKRGLLTLQKGQRFFEPMNRTSSRMEGTFMRLDERVSQVETMLLAMDDAQKKQQEIVNGSLQKILKWMAVKDEKEAKAAEQAALKARDADEEEEGIGKKVEDMSDNVKRLSQQIAEIAADRASSEASTKGMLVQAERLVNSKLASAEEIVAKMEDKLSTYYFTGLAAATTVAPPPLHNSEWENSVQSSLATIETNLKNIQSAQSEALNLHLEKEFYVTIANETLEAIEDMRIEVLAASDKSFTKTSMRIKEATTTLDGSLSEVLRTLNEAAPAGDDENTHRQSGELRSIVTSLGNLEKIVLTTDESIMKILRSVEINKRTIPQDIEESLKTHIASVNEALNAQFGVLGDTIHANHDGALTNLTSKIESEVSLVWRQIGNIAQDVQMSKSSLSKLHEQTENYVNGTSAVMDRMGGKVSQITSRMAEVDANLNYLLGRLSLVTQEFNNTRDGLGIALDKLRDSFKTVQEKIRAVGPGPHRIDSSENETG